MSSDEERRHPLSSEGGLAVRPVMARDPFEAIDDLMQVVEALCPRWPNREPFLASSVFKL